ncbi:MAG: hypothetical protein KGI25_03150 [Thaumarchaeota archaeon]|nr:hypothetical protein [Nitrososphaerota archaeon]
MRRGWIIGGTVLSIVSIPAYYFSPEYISQAAHSFVSSMTSGNSASSASMLHQMGYPHLSVVIAAIQYLLIGTAWAGIGFVAYGLVAKKKTKPMVVKLVAEQTFDESNMSPVQSSKTSKTAQTNQGNEQVSSEVVTDVLTKLETQLTDIKKGYENHKQMIEAEKKTLEQKERERMAKIITTGEVLIKEITPDKFEERVKYYVGLKNEETGQPIDLSLLAEKFEKMKKIFDSKGSSDLTSSEFDSFRRFLE